jgi:hypothetical protein
MTEFPKSSVEIRALAQELVAHLNCGIEDTQYREKWSAQNFDLLHRFADSKSCASYSLYRQYEYLWDFTAFIRGSEMLLVAESEWEPTTHEIAKDFAKLLYAKSPLKLMMCRIDRPQDTVEKATRTAEKVRLSLEKVVRDVCAYYSPGEAIILYCVWWAGGDGKNRDIAYILQMEGELGDKHFERVSWPVN